jgi:uncharacterized damage-inducible protein DinB
MMPELPIEDLLLPDEMHSEIALLFGALQDSTREWRENLGDVEAAAIAWQPYPSGPSIGGELLHLAAAETYWFSKFVEGNDPDATDPAIRFDNALDQYAGQWPTPPSESLAWYFDVLDHHRELTRQSLIRQPNPISLHPGSETRITLRWIVSHIVQHDSYHGGQAVLLHEMWKRLGPTG